MSKPICYQVKVRDWPVWTKFVVRDDVAEEYEQKIKNENPDAAVSIIPLYEHTDSAEIQKLTAQRDELLEMAKEMERYVENLDVPTRGATAKMLKLRELIAKVKQEMK